MAGITMSCAGKFGIAAAAFVLAAFAALPSRAAVAIPDDWPDAGCRTILKNCRDAMRDTDRLLVMEMLTVPCKPDLSVSIVGMMMLLYFGEARQRTVEEYKQLLGGTGFDLTRVLPTASAFSIVEAYLRVCILQAPHTFCAMN